MHRHSTTPTPTTSTPSTRHPPVRHSARAFVTPGQRFVHLLAALAGVLVMALGVLALLAVAGARITGQDAADATSVSVQTETLSPLVANAIDDRAVSPNDDVSVYVFFESGQECTECLLHRLRLAYYASEFVAAGAKVYALPVGSGEARAPARSAAWTVIPDRSGEIAAYFGVTVGSNRNGNPKVVVAHGDRVLLRAQARSVNDRIEAAVLTTVLAAHEDAMARR